MKERINEIEMPSARIVENTVEVQKELLSLGFNLDCNYAKKIEDPVEAEDGQRSTYWIEIKTIIDKEKSDNLRAGKLFVPKQHNGELVCFYAGMPGENTADWEQKYVNELSDNGYVVWIPRHNGIKLNEENQKCFINSPQAFEDYSLLGRENIANSLKEKFLDDFLEEPASDLSVFSKQDSIKEIILIGQSFGASSIINSLSQEKISALGIDATKIKKAIIINGLLGEGTFPESDEELIAGMRLTPKQLINDQEERASKFFNIQGKIEMRKTFQELFPLISKNKLPEGTDLIITASPTDAYLTLEGAKKYLNAQDRGLLIADLTHSETKPTKKGDSIFGTEFDEITPELVMQANNESKNMYGGSQHAAPNFNPETLVRLIKSKIIGKHEVSFSASFKDVSEE